MTREEFDKQILDILGKRDELRVELGKCDSRLKALRAKYVSEYPDLIRFGTKVHITVRCKKYPNCEIYIEEVDAFIGDNRILTGFDYDYSYIYKDESIATKLLKVKKDGTMGERVLKLNGKVLDIKILE